MSSLSILQAYQQYPKLLDREVTCTTALDILARNDSKLCIQSNYEPTSTMLRARQDYWHDVQLISISGGLSSLRPIELLRLARKRALAYPEQSDVNKPAELSSLAKQTTVGHAPLSEIVAQEGPASVLSEAKTEPQSDQEVKANFPRLLFIVLSDSKNDGIIEWMPCGKQFIILNETRFITEVMPRYFQKCKHSSFMRKLNRWGFSLDRTKRSYSNDSFLREHPRLMQQMFTREGKVKRWNNSTSAVKAIPEY